MNNDQLSSLIRSALKLIGAALIEHGHAAAGSFVTSESAIGLALAGLGFLWSYLHHAPTDTKGSGTGGGLAALILACGLSVAVLNGCSSTPSTVAYKTALGTEATVAAAMTAWGDYVAANHPGIAAETKVKAAYDHYKACELLAIDATSAIANGASGTNFDVGALSSQVSQSITDLIAVLQGFGVKVGGAQ